MMLSTSHEETVSYKKQAQAKNQRRSMWKVRSQENLEGKKISIFKIEKYGRLVLFLLFCLFSNKYAVKRALHTSLIGERLTRELFVEINLSISTANKILLPLSKFIVLIKIWPKEIIKDAQGECTAEKKSSRQLIIWTWINNDISMRYSNISADTKNY